jgi:hypothetical protein
MLRVTTSLLVAMLVPVIFWVGGFEFERGAIAVFCIAASLFVFVLTVSCPLWDELRGTAYKRGFEVTTGGHDMYVHWVEITEAQQEACVSAMKKRFRASDIESAAIQAGVPKYNDRNGIAHRVADRLIQRQRKAGKIKRDGVYWVPA